jgi:hypothetical protein
VRKFKGVGMTIGGWTMFGSAYLLTVLGGVIAIDNGNERVGRALLIPVVGPFAGFARLDFDGDNSAGLALGTTGMVFSGIFQVAGLALGLAGVGLLARARAEERYGVQLTPGGVQLRF